MARRTIFAQKEINLISEEINIETRTTNEFTANGSPVVTLATLPPSGLVLAPVGAVPNANAATLVGSTLNLEPGSYAFPGLINTLAQAFQGTKGFDQIEFNNGSLITSTSGQLNVIVPQIDFTVNLATFRANLQRILTDLDLLVLGPVGAVPNANGATITGSTLTLQPANYASPGLINTLAQAFQGTKGFDQIEFNNGSLITSTSGQLNVTAPQIDFTVNLATFRANLQRILTDLDLLVLGPVGAVPNANGATITGTTLVLQPADATNPGIVTTGAQNFGGTKGVDQLNINSNAGIQSAGQLNFTLPSESNFKVNTKRILNTDDLYNQPLTGGGNLFASDPSSPELVDFEVPLQPGTVLDMTVFAGPPGSAYLLFDKVGSTYFVNYKNHAINTNVQMVRMDIYLNSDASFFTSFTSSLANHTLSGQADHRCHTFTPLYISQAFRVVFVCYSSAIAPGNVQNTFNDLLVQGVERHV